MQTQNNQILTRVGLTPFMPTEDQNIICTLDHIFGSDIYFLKLQLEYLVLNFTTFI
jgi:hypothetical protein